ncbi:MAG: hypothetical protein ABJA10_09030, partial [Aestuariivirga sp.]
MASAVLLDKSHTETVDIGTFNSIEIKVAGEAHPVGKWVTFTSRGYVTIEEARLRGQNFSDLLSIAGCLGKLGVDVGFNKSTLQFSEQIAANVHAKTGKRLVGEVHGLLTYESDTVA